VAVIVIRQLNLVQKFNRIIEAEPMFVGSSIEKPIVASSVVGHQLK